MKYIYCLERILAQEEESPQLSFDFEEREIWSKMFWPSDEHDVKKVVQEYYNSLKNPGKARVLGTYNKEGDTWVLIPLK